MRPRFIFQLILPLTVFLPLLSPSSTLAQTTATITAGPEEIMRGPSSEYIDNPFRPHTIPGGIRAFNANANTASFTGPDLDHLQFEGVALEKGSSGNFDECGAWLDAVYKLTATHWIGWYHAEEKCDYSIGQSHQSIAFTQSLDSGKTWTRPNYPLNQIITSDIPLITNQNSKDDDVGGPSLIIKDDYLYLYFNCGWSTCIARSKISDRGRPGTWFKYYQSDFTEPGLGGHSTVLSNISASTYVSYNQYLNSYINIAANAKWGFRFYESTGTNLLSWNKDPKPMFIPEISYFSDSRANNWSAPTRNQNLHIYGYPSIIGLDGNTQVSGQSFYLYYMKLYPHENFTQRYLARRKITLGHGTFHQVALSSPIDLDAPKPGSPPPSLPGPYGYLVPHPMTGLSPVYHCQTSTGADFLTTADPTPFTYEHCQNNSDTFIRKLGYLSSTATSTFSHPLVNPLNNQVVGYIIPPSPISLPGDLNGDGSVNLLDYNLLKAGFGTTYNLLDYNTLRNNFGQ
ncbi:MAG: hypothetical protein ACD_40C00277G0001 [uncultured bacterium]|nr:MAG: hypothetical protein ACD_40C00277G0001 [uncultured bacterium]